jgi:hypothetical protein
MVEEARTADEEGEEAMGEEAGLMEGEAADTTVEEETEDTSLIERWVQSQSRKGRKST